MQGPACAARWLVKWQGAGAGRAGVARRELETAGVDAWRN